MKYFNRLFSNISFSEFVENYWQKKPILLSSSNKSPFFLNLDEVKKILSNPSITYPHINVISSGKKVGRKLIENKRNSFNPLDKENLNHLYKNGETIAIQKVHFLNERFFKLIKELENHILMSVGANIYISPSFSSSGFHPHYDTHDIFIFQLHGKKRWRIFDNPVGLPNSDEPFIEKQHKNYFKEIPSQEFDLNEGDILYMPRGWVHNAFTLERESIHMTLGFHRTLLPKLPDTKAKYYIGSKKINIENQTKLLGTLHEVDSLWSDSLTPNYFKNKLSYLDISINSIVEVNSMLRFKVYYQDNLFKIETANNILELPNKCLNAFTKILKSKKSVVNDIDENLHDSSKVLIASKLFDIGIISIRNNIENPRNSVTINLNKHFFFPLSPNNEILNPTNKSLISDNFKTIINKITFLINEFYQQVVISLYLRGSVALGQATISSDLDLIIVLRNKAQAKTILKDLDKIYSNISCTFYQEKNILKNSFAIFTLQTQSLFLLGKEVCKDLPAPKIEIGNRFFLVNYKQTKSFFLESIFNQSEKETILSLVSGLMKYLLRIGFEVVMLKEMQFTREICTCYKTIIKYYPEDKIFFYQILYLAINPETDKNIVSRVLNKFDYWLQTANKYEQTSGN